MSVDFLTNQEVIVAARKNLPHDVWDYVMGGTESETTLCRNRLGFDMLALRPRVLIDVSHVDTSTTFLGQKLRIPVVTAPIGGLHKFTPEGGLAVAKAAHEFGWLPILSSAVRAGFEAVGKSTPGPKVLQLAIRGDIEWCRDVVQRAKQANYIAVCMTVDSPVAGRRERQMLNRWKPPSTSDVEVLQGDSDFHRWTEVVDWQMLNEIKKMGLPLLVKGISTAEDAKLAVEHGVDVVYVSNHAGHGLDHGFGTIDVLSEIVEVVNGKAEIILDSGIMRGTDVIKALALGARCVAIGKLMACGLAAAGQEGLTRVFEILEQELVVDMSLLGTTAVSQINRNHICAARPVTFPTELSAFPHLPS